MTELILDALLLAGPENYPFDASEVLGWGRRRDEWLLALEQKQAEYDRGWRELERELDPQPNPLMSLYTELTAASDPLALVRTVPDTMLVGAISWSGDPTRWSEQHPETLPPRHEHEWLVADRALVLRVHGDANPVLLLLHGLGLMRERPVLPADCEAVGSDLRALQIRSAPDRDPALEAEAHRLAAGLVDRAFRHIGRIEWLPDGPDLRARYWSARSARFAHARWQDPRTKRADQLREWEAYVAAQSALGTQARQRRSHS